jgi:hypothetical protein
LPHDSQVLVSDFSRVLFDILNKRNDTFYPKSKLFSLSKQKSTAFFKAMLLTGSKKKIREIENLPLALVAGGRLFGGFDSLFAGRSQGRFALRIGSCLFERIALLFERGFQARLNLRRVLGDFRQAGFVFFDVFVAFGNAHAVSRSRVGFRRVGFVCIGFCRVSRFRGICAVRRRCRRRAAAVYQKENAANECDSHKESHIQVIHFILTKKFYMKKQNRKIVFSTARIVEHIFGNFPTQTGR